MQFCIQRQSGKFARYCKLLRVICQIKLQYSMTILVISQLRTAKHLWIVSWDKAMRKANLRVKIGARKYITCLITSKKIVLFVPCFNTNAFYRNVLPNNPCRATERIRKNRSKIISWAPMKILFSKPKRN